MYDDEETAQFHSVSLHMDMHVHYMQSDLCQLLSVAK